jgi:hypothetical protein
VIERRAQLLNRGGRLPVGALARVEEVELVLHLLGLGRAREHHRVPAPLDVGDQLARPP